MQEAYLPHVVLVTTRLEIIWMGCILENNSKEEVQIENLVSFIPFFISCLPQCSYLVSQFPKTEKCYHRTSIFLEFLLTRHPYWNLDSQKPEATLPSTRSSLPGHPLSRRLLSRSSHPSAYRTLPHPHVHVLYAAGSGAPLQDSCLENPVDGGAWWAAVHGVARRRTRLSDFTFTFHFHALEKAMATHSSVLAWRIPGMGEPGGLPSMGSHRVGHDWSDLAAAATWSVLCHFTRANS